MGTRLDIAIFYLFMSAPVDLYSRRRNVSIMPSVRTETRGRERMKSPEQPKSFATSALWLQLRLCARCLTADLSIRSTTVTTSLRANASTTFLRNPGICPFLLPFFPRPYFSRFKVTADQGRSLSQSSHTTGLRGSLQSAPLHLTSPPSPRLTILQHRFSYLTIAFYELVLPATWSCTYKQAAISPESAYSAQSR